MSVLTAHLRNLLRALYLQFVLPSPITGSEYTSMRAVLPKRTGKASFEVSISHVPLLYSDDTGYKVSSAVLVIR